MSPRPRKRGPGLVRAALWAGFLCTLIGALDLAFPPDLSRYHDRSALVTAEDGTPLRAFLSGDEAWRLAARPDQVAPAYRTMLLAYEDKRFASHPGIDPLAAARATVQFARNGKIVSGASTLTMQTARLLEPGRRGLLGKGKQILRALQLERRFSKDEILSIYLTLAPFGGNIEGVRAASLAYFGKEPAHLTPAQAALLVALPQAPEARRPDRFPDAAKAGRDQVLARMAAAKILPERTVREAMAEPVPDARRAFPFHAPRLARRLQAQTPQANIIRTTIDIGLQRQIEALAARERDWLEPSASFAFLVTETQTGKVRAYLGGADFAAPQGQVDVIRALRSPGSALKPFIYGVGFDALTLHPETLIDDRPQVFGSYAPRNFDRDFQGTVPVRYALQQSLNVPAVAVLDRLGPARLAGRLTRGGAELAFGGPDGTRGAPGLPMALGGAGISLWDLTQLYSGIAAGGAVRPLTVRAHSLERPARRLMSGTAAWYVTDILKDSPVPDGWVHSAAVLKDRQIAFKTGTSYGYRDAWTFGWTEDWTVGVWAGRPDGTPRPGRFGRNEAAPLMLKLFDLLPAPQTGKATAAPPDPVLEVGNRQRLPQAMRHFRLAQFRAPGTDGPPPEIAFPPDGAVLRLEEEGPAPLPLRAVGGTGPLRWLVDGALLPPSEAFSVPEWTPDGPGFVKLSVVDAKGRSAQARIRLMND